MKRYPNLSAALLFALIVVGFYAPVVFFGRSLLSPLYYPLGVTSEGPYGFSGRRPVNTFNVELSSAAYYEAPLNYLVGQLYRRGSLPLWNPYQAAGMPLAAQYSSRAFFPYQIAEDLSPVRAWDAFMLGRLWLAGFLTFLFLAQLGVSRGGAFLGGVFYMLSGTMVWWINFEQMTNVAMVTPLLFLCLGRQLRLGRARDLALSAAAFALVLLAGQPEVALYVLLLAGSFALLLAWLGAQGLVARLRALSGVAAAFVLGLALSAPLIAPFVEGMREMVSLHPVGLFMGVRNPIAWKYLLGTIMPVIFEYPIAHRQLPDNGMWDYLGAYVGVTPLFLMIAGLLLSLFEHKPRHRAPLVFFGAFGVGLLLKHHGWAPFIWIGHLPLFDITWSQRWGAPMWTFSLAVAGGLGWEIIRETGASAAATSPAARLRGLLAARVPAAVARSWRLTGIRVPAMAKFLLAVCAVSLFALVTLVIADGISTYTEDAIEWLERAPAHPPLLQEAAYFWPSVALSVAIGLLTLAGLIRLTLAHSQRADRWCLGVAALALTELWFAIPHGYPAAWASLEAVPVLFGFLAAAACFRDRRRLAAAAAGAALLSFIVIDYEAPAGFPDRFDPFTPAPYVEFLKRQPGHHRIVGSGGVLMPNFASALGVQDLRYVAALAVKSIHTYRTEFLHAYPLWGASGDALWFNGQPFISVRVAINNIPRTGRIPRPFTEDVRARLRQYSFLGVKYIVVPRGEEVNGPPTRESADGRPPRFPLVYDREVRIYENPAVLPRVFIARQVAYAPTFEAAQQISNAPNFDLRNRVVLEEPAPKGYEAGDLPAGGGVVEITRYEPSNVTVQARSAPAGVLVLTDVFYPGWRARVDGQPAKVYRVDGVARGVFIPPGTHVVEFSYFPASFMIGLIVATGALLVCIALLLVPAAPAGGGSALGH